MFYPHKQTAIIFILCVLGVLVTVWYVGRGDVRGKETDNTMSIKQNKQVIQAGVAIATTTDWQKQFFVSSTSTPSKKDVSTTKNQNTDEPDTITGRFGKKVFEQYMLLKQNNLAEDPTAVKAVVDQNVNDFISTAPQAEVYDIRSVVLANTSDLSAERTYANAVGSILSTYTPQGDMAMIANQALEENDPTKIKEVEAIANSYSIMLKRLLVTPTPKTLAGYHINLINGVSSVAFVAEGMSKVFSDPVQGMVALAVYEKSLLSLQNALLDLKYNFSQKQILFSNNEPATVFNLIK